MGADVSKGSRARTATLVLADRSTRTVAPPERGARHAVANGACPACAAEPFLVAGDGIRIADDDRHWEADGLCLACKAVVGLVRVRAETIFGLRMDREVLEGRPRVYG